MQLPPPSRRSPTCSSLVSACSLLPLLLLFVLLAAPSSIYAQSAPPGFGTAPQTRKFDWVVQYVNVTRLCHTKQIITINGQFPGPTTYVREGDTVLVNVTNMVSHNITIHWHGVRQVQSAWADGPAYITQCPLQTGRSYVHNFTIVEQRGTLFYHAHLSWLRATVHGAFIMLPKAAAIYPFTTPYTEIPIIIGEWWIQDVEYIVSEALRLGGTYNFSDAITINGQPGALYNCSLADTPVFNVTKGKTYLLRIINAAVNFQMYVGVAGHNLTVVETDAEYTKPYTTNILVVAPGQTTNVLLTADQPIGQYFISASVYNPAAQVPYPLTPATAILRYEGASTVASPSLTLPSFPVHNDTAYAMNFSKSLRGQLYSRGFYYYPVPTTIDEDLFFTIGYAFQPCPTCTTGRFPGTRLAASVNNVTFKDATVSLLQAYYNHISGVYEDNFPSEPLFQYNYTGPPPSNNFVSVLATKVKVLEFGQNVQIIFQDTSTFFFEGHPIHLHGQNFYIVGEGFGTFNATTDPPNFNLVDPPSRNTVAVPSGGWAAVRFRTTNPGVWYMHCHFDIHNSWGMAMAFIVKDGGGPFEKLPPPPADLPPC